MLAGAAEAKLEGRIVPVVRTRAAGISQLPHLEDKLRAWAKVAEVRPEPLLACMAALDQAPPEVIAARLIGSDTDSTSSACHELPEPLSELV